MKAAALLLVLAVPLASAADTAVLTFDTEASARLVVDDLRSMAESVFLRRSADAFGDRDGVVSEAEAQQGTAIARPTVEREVKRQVEGGNLTLDGKVPVTAELKAFSLTNMTGPVDRPDPVVAHAEVALLFEVEAGSAEHTLFSRVRPTSGQYNVTVWAPPGYVAQGAGAAEGRSAQFVAEPGSAGQTVLFQLPPQQTEGHSSPAGGVGLALWAVGGALALRRRRP